MLYHHANAPINSIVFYVYQNLSRMELGNFHGAIEDAAEALAIVQLDKENIHQGGGNSHSRVRNLN
jgi:hypothetical protein